MSIENKIVADFYARLYPWIDHSRDVLVCQDDGGAGAAATPDLCFHFQHAEEQMRIESKTFYAKKGGVIGCTNKQIGTWSTAKGSGVAPQLWVVVKKPNKFLIWHHDDPVFQKNFASAKPSSKTHFDVCVPAQEWRSFIETFLFIMQYAVDHHLLL